VTTALKPDDIRWRVSNTWDKDDRKMGMLVGYIDARTAMEALDALDPDWSSRMEPIAVDGESGVRCSLTVKGVTREDVGVPSNTEPLKGAFSDALKRTAVHFGIGRELYELPRIAVECDVGQSGKVKGPKALPVFRNGRWDIDHKLGWVRYDREPEEPQPAEAQTEATPEAALTGKVSLRQRVLELGEKHGIAPESLRFMAEEACAEAWDEIPKENLLAFGVDLAAGKYDPIDEPSQPGTGERSSRDDAIPGEAAGAEPQAEALQPERAVAPASPPAATQRSAPSEEGRADGAGEGEEASARLSSPARAEKGVPASVADARRRDRAIRKMEKAGLL
jgi:hypothetical protein